MLDYLEQLTSRYREKGVLLDTNLLLLLVVGIWKIEQIPRFKRTQTFTTTDFAILEAYLSAFETIVTTPHIATETSNLLGQLPAQSARASRTVFRRLLHSEEKHSFVEVIDASASLSAQPMFPRFGLADTALGSENQGQRLILTDDLPLFHYLSQTGVDALNYNYLRTANW